ncbi:MAG: tandem-95 repeat protein, partial [Verrucomicrobia bacterium]
MQTTYCPNENETRDAAKDFAPVADRRAPLTRVWLLALALCAVTLAGHAQTITRVSAPGKYYVDDKAGAGIVYNYEAFMISNNTASTLSNIYVVATNFVSTNMITLGTTDRGVRAVGDIPAGQARMAAFYLKGPSFTGNSDTVSGLTNENHTIRILNGAPGIGSLLLATNFGFTNIIYVTEALANKVTIITNLNPYALLGDDVDLVIGGDTGTIGGENSISFSPAVLGTWRPDAYELVGVKVHFTENPDFVNRLYFDPTVSGFTNYTGQSYTNTFTFRAIRVTGTNIGISPFAFVDSGSGTKHTAVSSLANSAGSNVIYSATNSIAIVGQTVSPSSLLAPGGTVTYTVLIQNYADTPITLNEIRDTLPGTPGNFTFVAGSTTYNSNAIADPNIVGQVLRWAIPFVVPSNSIVPLVFQAVAPLPAGTYTNSVIAFNGSEQVDTTTITTDNVPSLSFFTIIPVSDLGVSKTSPTNVLAGNNFDYTITVTNLGPSPNTSFSVTDNLPAEVTFVSASAGGVFAGGQVIWTNLPTLDASNSTTLTITVTAPAEAASLTNTAVVNSPILDPNSTNNTTPPVITSVGSAANLVVAKSGPPSAVSPGANFDYSISVTNLGASVAVSVTVTDALPANVTFVSATGGGVFGGGSVIWNLGNFAAGQFTNLTLTVTAPLKGGMTNVASGASSTLDTNLVNNTTPPVTTTVSNVAPTAVSDTSSTPRNVAVTIPATLNDNDPNGDTLTITLVSPTNGTASIVSGTNVLFTPDTNYLGNATIGYTISDGLGGFSSALITITVSNRPPVAAPDSTTGTNGVPQVINPLVNDSDADGDTIIITNAVAVNGIVSINAGSTNLTYTPTNDLTGTITYTITDGFGGSASAVITVVGLNTAPVANNDSTNTPVNVPVTIRATLNDTDVNSDPITIVTVSPTNGTATIVNGTNVLFTPTTNFDGTATIGYTISDGNGGFATGLITVTVTPVADVGVSKSSPSPVTAGANFNYTITLTNLGPSASGSLSVTDNLPASVTFVSASDGGFFTGSQVIWTNLPALPANTGTNLTLTVTAPANGTGLTNTASVGGPVSDPNPTNNTTPPNLTTVVSSADLSISKVASTNAPQPGANFNYTLTVTNAGPSTASSVTVTDALPANLTFVSASAGGVFSGGNVTWSLGSLAANASTNLTLTVTAPVKGGITNAASVGSPTGDPNPTNSVSPPATNSVANVAPTAVNDFTSTSKNVGVSVPVLVNDSDANGDTLSIFAVSPTNGTASISGTNVSFTPTSGFTGSATCGYTISDGLGGFASAVITITVTNRPPTASGQGVSTAEDTAKAITLAGSDPDTDPLTYIIVAGPTNGSFTSINTNTGAFTYLPNPNFNGTDAFTFRVNDGSSNSLPALVNITVTPVNDAPTANGQSVTTPEDTSTNLLLTATDVDSTNFTFTIVAGPTNGTFTSINTNTGAFTYLPNPNFNGSDAFTFRVSDGSSNSLPALVTINVTPVNDAPTANGQSVTTPEDTATNLVLTATDVDSTNFTFTILAGPTNGTFTSINTNTGAFTYKPNTNFNGSDAFTFRVNDGSSNSLPALVTINVTPVNDAPTANGQSVTTPEDTATNIVLTATDVDSTNFTFTILVGPTNGTFTSINTNTGAFTYLPNPNFSGSDAFTFRVNDGSSNSLPALVSITVTPVNDAPVANGDSYTATN